MLTVELNDTGCVQGTKNCLRDIYNQVTIENSEKRPQANVLFLNSQCHTSEPVKIPISQDYKGKNLCQGVTNINC